jgi:hypothetical protein
LLGICPGELILQLIVELDLSTHICPGELILRLIVELDVLSRQDNLLPEIYLEVELLQVLFLLSFTSINQLTSFHSSFMGSFHGLMPT